MSVKQQSAKIDRRGFLKGTAILGGAAATAAVSGGVVAEPQVETPAKEQGKSRGYHVTPHILEYYEKARF